MSTRATATRSIGRFAGIIVALAIATGLPGESLAQPAGVDPEAMKVLRRMTDFLSSQKQFSVDTQNVLEAVLTSGQKIQFDQGVTLTIQRPNKLRSERKGDLVSQVFYYDGKSLSLHNPAHKYYATVAAPDTLEAALDFARESLGIVAPASDLIYRNAFEILTQGVTSSFVVGKSAVGGVRCTHLAFRGPEVDWQIWIADGAQPLPRKYVITSKQVAQAPEFIVTMSAWNLSPKVTDGMFRLAPPRDAKKIDFLPATLAGASPR